MGFIGVALSAQIVGYVAYRTNRNILYEVRKCQRSVSKVGYSSEMNIALQSSQIACQELMGIKLKTYVSSPEEHAEIPARIAEGYIRDSLGDFEKNLYLNERIKSGTFRFAPTGGLKASETREMRKTDIRINDIRLNFELYRQMVFQFMALVGIDIGGANDLLEKNLDPHFHEKLIPLIRSYREDSGNELKKEIGRIELCIFEANKSILATSLGVLLAATILGLVIARSISKPLLDLKDKAEKIGKGDLDIRIDYESSNEIGVLSKKFHEDGRQSQRDHFFSPGGQGVCRKREPGQKRISGKHEP